MILSKIKKFEKNRRKMTKSGAHCEGNENRKSQKPFFFRELNDSKHFQKIFFLDDPKFSKSGSHLKKNFFRFQIFPGPEIFRDAS